MEICSVDFTVDLPEVGENNEFSNKGFLRILQEAACVHSKKLGISVYSSKIDGLAWVILNWSLKVYSRPGWNEKLRVDTWCRKVSHIFFYRDFEVYDESNNLIASATSKWVLFDLNKGELAKIDSELKEKYSSPDEKSANIEMKEKLTEPESSQFVYEYRVSRRDIDTNHHVNNLNYVDFAYEALPENVYLNSDFNNVEIMYKNEAKIGDTLNLFYSNVDGTIYITIKNKDNTKVHCIVKLS